MKAGKVVFNFVKSMQDNFLRPEVHKTLLSMTSKDPNLVHKADLFEPHLPTIKLLSDNELAKAKTQSLVYTRQRLQMPPIMVPKSDQSVEELTLQEDPSLRGLFPEGHKLVFVDISLSHQDQKRPMLVRDCQGNLRKANTEERRRLDQTYFPFPGRKNNPPMMFFGELLQSMLNRGRYVYLLDRATVQFEPDDPLFVNTYLTTYEHILNLASRNVDEALSVMRKLRSTRYYGGFVLFSALNWRVGHILLELVASQQYAIVWNLLKLLDSLHSGHENLKEIKLALDEMNVLDSQATLTAQQEQLVQKSLRQFLQTEVVNSTLAADILQLLPAEKISVKKTAKKSSK